MGFIYKGISEEEFGVLLKELTVTSGDDILVHGSKLDSTNYEVVTTSIFNKGVSKNTGNVAPFMSILATTSLLDTKYDLASQITNYHVGNTVFVIRIPKEYKGIYLGNINQKYASRVSGLQDECVCILDLLELEHIPAEFVVCSLKKSNETYGKYDVVVNPHYFQIDKNNILKEKLVETIENSRNDVVKSIVKDYMNIENLDKDIFYSYMDLLDTFFLKDSDFVKELYDSKEKKISKSRK